MQQRQPRLGDILDDYCPRERRLTNHAVVAMVGDDVKQTRCTTCEAEHEYKHAKVPRQRRKTDAPAALYAHVLAGGPKRVVHETEMAVEEDQIAVESDAVVPAAEALPAERAAKDDEGGSGSTPPEPQDEEDQDVEEGPVHRPLIRATLPRTEGQAPPVRPAPEFTIRQPGGRPNRFRPRQQRGGPFTGNHSNGNMGGGGPMRSGSRPSGGRPFQGAPTSRLARRHGPGRKRSK